MSPAPSGVPDRFGAGSSLSVPRCAVPSATNRHARRLRVGPPGNGRATKRRRPFAVEPDRRVVRWVGGRHLLAMIAVTGTAARAGHLGHSTTRARSPGLAITVSASRRPSASGFLEDDLEEPALEVLLRVPPEDVLESTVEDLVE